MSHKGLSGAQVLRDRFRIGICCCWTGWLLLGLRSRSISSSVEVAAGQIGCCWHFSRIQSCRWVVEYVELVERSGLSHTESRLHLSIRRYKYGTTEAISITESNLCFFRCLISRAINKAERRVTKTEAFVSSTAKHRRKANTLTARAVGVCKNKKEGRMGKKGNWCKCERGSTPWAG
ncbi:hypothetical protein BDV25DRAFT_41174 [Aspergillus avenaceus]|uniref:Uncharacterized protein n=1 Tax=Aspergillus avenaceus TaxID=36643 RepID=A0A5N6TL20_ASPAV|nr:hypothetical protein BDV25DRAFT_41174 [Aspergillus avenaceus]